MEWQSAKDLNSSYSRALLRLHSFGKAMPNKFFAILLCAVALVFASEEGNAQAVQVCTTKALVGLSSLPSGDWYVVQAKEDDLADDRFLVLDRELGLGSTRDEFNIEVIQLEPSFRENNFDGDTASIPRQDQAFPEGFPAELKAEIEKRDQYSCGIHSPASAFMKFFDNQEALLNVMKNSGASQEDLDTYQSDLKEELERQQYICLSSSTVLPISVMLFDAKNSSFFRPTIQGGDSIPVVLKTGTCSAL